MSENIRAEEKVVDPAFEALKQEIQELESGNNILRGIMSARNNGKSLVDSISEGFDSTRQD